MHLRWRSHPHRRGHCQWPAKYVAAAAASPAAYLTPDSPTPTPARPSSSTPSAATAACSLPWALKPAAVCSDTGSAADGTTVVIAGAAPACAAANRAVIDSTAALAEARPSGTTRSVMTHTPFDENHRPSAATLSSTSGLTNCTYVGISLSVSRIARPAGSRSNR